MSGTLLNLSSTSTYESSDNFNINHQPPSTCSIYELCSYLLSNTGLCRRLLLRKSVFINTLAREPSSLLANDHSFQPIPNSSHCSSIPPDLSCCAHFNNLIFCQSSINHCCCSYHSSRVNQKQIEDSNITFRSSVHCHQSFQRPLKPFTTTAHQQSTSSLLQLQASPPLSTLHAVSSRLPVNPNHTI